MAKLSSGELTYFLSFPKSSRQQLYHLRIHGELKVATAQDGTLWVSGVEKELLNAPEVLTIPGLRRYYAQKNKLFLLGSLLPVMTMPTLLWSPIKQYLTVTLPDCNHNYFGVHQKVRIRLDSAKMLHPSVAMIVELEQLQAYVSTVAAIRLASLSWILWGFNEALIFGNPILPLPGKEFWENGDQLMPIGMDFALTRMVDLMTQKFPRGDHWIIWQADSTCVAVPKFAFKPLSRSSLRLTIAQLG